MKVELEGFCLSGGHSRVEISHSKNFALYLHLDSREPLSLAYEIQNIRITDHLVSVGEHCRLKVVEHLFSALYGMNFFNIKLDVYGDELPFFDGSSVEFVSALERVSNGRPPQSTRLRERVVVEEGDSSIRYLPHLGDELVIDMELSHSYIGTQRIILRLSPEVYKKEIAPARTFVFTNEDDPRLTNMPPYGIGITEKGIHSTAPLRFPDEPVRHKVLDLLGDLYILKQGLYGKIVGKNTSHHLNLEFARRLMLVKGGDGE